jgi:hypothetical protein
MSLIDHAIKANEQFAKKSPGRSAGWPRGGAGVFGPRFGISGATSVTGRSESQAATPAPVIHA